MATSNGPVLTILGNGARNVDIKRAPFLLKLEL